MQATYNTIEIWAPRFKDKYGATRSPVALVAPYRVQSGMNRVVFTKTMLGKHFLMDGAKMKSYPMESNGTIGCLAIPLKDFEREPNNQEQLL